MDVQVAFSAVLHDVKDSSCFIMHCGKRRGVINISLDPDPTRYVHLKLRSNATQGQVADENVLIAKAGLLKQEETEHYYRRLKQAVVIAGCIWGVASNSSMAIPLVGIPAAVLATALKALVAQCDRDNDVQQLGESMCQMLEMANSTLKVANRPELKVKLDEVRSAVTACAKFIELNTKQGFTERLARDTFGETKRDQIDELKRRFARLTQDCERETRLQEVEHNQQAEARREDRSRQMPPPWTPIPEAPGARYDPGNLCLPDTRKTIRRAIELWSLDMDAGKVLWLNGAAGSGKSAIANTIAHWLDSERRLAACFFFNRDREGLNRPNNVITTLGAQLLESQPAAEVRVPKTIAEESFAYQFQRLILQPLKRISADKPIILVLDGFDECGNKLQRARLLAALVNGATDLPPHVKLFISSRPEPDLSDALEDRAVQVKTDTADTEIEDDITAYIKHMLSSLPQIRRPLDWPSEETIHFLTERSSHLFIWAEVATKFVMDNTKDPQEQIAVLRRVQARLIPPIPSDTLNRLYRTVLSSPDVVDGSLYVIGAIAVVKDPLSTSALDRLLGLASTEFERSLIFLDNDLRHIPSSKLVISPLRSVLRWDVAAQKETVRLLHPSLALFLGDRIAATDQFFVDPKSFHNALLSRCIITMRHHLCRNICGNKDPRTANSDVAPEVLIRCIPEHVRYACRYWATHLSECGGGNSSLWETVRNFMFQHLLHWVEAMSMIGSLDEVFATLRAVRTWIQQYAKPEDPTMDCVKALVEDCSQLVERFYTPISYCSSHIYASALSFSPPGKLLLSTFLPLVRQKPRVVDGLVKEWPSLLRVTTQDGSVEAVSFSPDAMNVASGSDDGTVRMWSVQSGEPLFQPLRGHEKPVTSVAFSPDGILLASGSKDKTIQVWNVRTGKTSGYFLQGHEGAVTSVAFSPNGMHIASGSSDNTIRIWKLPSGQQIGQPLRGHSMPVSSVAFSSDRVRIVSGSQDSTVRIWDVLLGELIGQPLRGHELGVTSVAFSPDGMSIASGSGDSTIRTWNAQSGKALGQPLRGHEGSVTSLAFSPDGKRIVSVSSDKTVRIWSSHSRELIGQPLRGHKMVVRSVSFSPDGVRVVSGSSDKTSRIWNSHSVQPAGQPLLPPSKQEIATISLSPDGTRIASGIRDGIVHIRSTHTGELIGQPLGSHKDEVTSVAFSPDGASIVAGYKDCNIRVWSVQSAELSYPPLRGHIHEVTSVGFSPDAACIASGSRDGTVRVWDAKSGEPVGQPMCGHEMAVGSVAFSPDGMRIVSGSWDNTLRIWDRQSGSSLIQPVRGHEREVMSVVFSADGKRIVSGSGDSTVRIWSAKSGDPIGQPLRGHEKPVNSVAISPKGGHVASGSEDTTVRIWSVQSGEQIEEPLRGHERPVTSVAFSADGAILASCSRDGTIRLSEISECMYEDHSNRIVPTLRLVITPLKVFNFSGQEGALGFTEASDGWIVDHHNRKILWVPDEYQGMWGPAFRSYLALGRLGAENLVLDLAEYLDSMPKE